MSKQITTCPACTRKSLVTHCGDEHPTCTWHKCRNEDCDAVLDLGRQRGHVKAGTGRKNVVLGGAA